MKQWYSEMRTILTEPGCALLLRPILALGWTVLLVCMAINDRWEQFRGKTNL